MLSLLKKIFGSKETETPLKKMLAEGAILLDVRTPGEYSSGHIDGAINVPLQSLYQQISFLKKKNKPIITCCLSGGRSLTAKKILADNGIEAYDGGGWRSLQSKLN